MPALSVNGLPDGFEERFPRLLARGSAALAALIGGLALTGWATGTEPLVGPAHSPPLYPNAAIALIGAAVSLRVVDTEHRLLARIGAGLAVIIGGLTLLQYLTGASFAIDRLLLPETAVLPNRIPGRMPAGSALCLFLSGIGLLCLTLTRENDAVDIVAGVLGVTVAGIGGIVLLGHLSGVLQSLRTSMVAGISLPGSVALFLIGSSIVALAWRRDMALAHLPRWSPAAIGIAGVTATVLFWRALVQHDNDQLAERLRYEAAEARQAVATQIDGLVKDLSRLGTRTGQLALENWTSDAATTMRDVDAHHAIVWRDSTDSIRAVVPSSRGSEVERLAGSRRSTAVDTVLVHGTATDPLSAELLEENRVLALRVAACPEPGRCSGVVEGYIVLANVFRRALGGGDPEHCITISTGGRVLFAREENRCAGDLQGFAYLGVGPLNWTLAAGPTPGLVQTTTSPLPVVLLCLGIVVSGLMATSLRLAQTSWQLARTAERRQVTRALESATEGIWEWNLATEQMQRSAMWRGLRYDSKEPAPTLAAWAALIHPDDLPAVQRAIQQHLTGGCDPLILEYRIKAADGTWHWMMDRARVVERTALGAPTLVLGVYADVTERRAADEALAASERRFRTMFDSTFQFQALLDLDGTLLEANRTALEFAGRELEEVRDFPLWETHWWAGRPEREDRLQDACSRARKGETVQYQEEVQGAAGRTAIVEFSVKPVYDNSGQVSQLLAEGRDITEQKRAEDALRAVDALSTIGRLAARVAHEINNPLAGIQSSFMLLKDAVPETHRYHRYVGAIEREIDRIAIVTRELYGMYRAEVAERNESSVAAAISDAVALLDQLHRGSVRIEADTSRAPGVIPHPDALVRQVVFNLIQNAVEASPPNGTVDVTAWTENGTFHFSVQDQGPGVPPAMRDRIFEDFYSTKTGLTTAGMGLGLSIVRRSLRALRGEIEIQDAPGGGADFHVRLPLR